MFIKEPTDSLLTPLPNLRQNTSRNLGIPDWIKQIEADISEALNRGEDIRQLVKARSDAADNLLSALFDLHDLHNTSLAMFAVGGYGRGELSPHSDLDLLLLAPQTLTVEEASKVDSFVARLWDVGIKPGLSVRTTEECFGIASDITVATSLLEARLLAGNDELTAVPMNIVNETWSQEAFYDAKMEEARIRYLRHNSTEYNLEPDIKNAPGGLRDIHTLSWVTKRYFRINKLYDLVPQDFLTEKEFDELMLAEGFLWQIRHHLHHLTGRDENKLLFDYQRDIAQRMGYEALPDDEPNAAVESFMRDYYRCAMQISSLSEMLTAHYYEVLIEARLPDEKRPEKTVLNARFNKIGNHIAISNHHIFAQHPDAILEMFLLMGQHDIKLIRTRTLRALKIAARGIDQNYRENPKHQNLFLDNLKEQNYLYHRLRFMQRYGVLANYLPQFASLIGLMQYDLFHRYTVDAHILLLVRMLHRFTDPKYKDDFALVGSIYKRIKRKEIIILAAIFHDIAKGRGGDHSELGEIDAIEFCLAHGMTEADAKLVGWLTRYHLLMSLTAQKKDISDPEVVAEFANLVGNVTHLNHLYVLTVADMNATNLQLWNSWRAILMKQLYTQTRRILRADLDAPTNRQDMIASTRQQAELLLDKVDNQHMKKEEVLVLWDELGDEYFLREIPEDIIWHTEAILNHPPIGKASSRDSEPLVVLREHRELALDAVQAFIYTPDQANLFAVTMAVFDQMSLDVLDARIITGTRDFALDSYVLLDQKGILINDPEARKELTERLIDAFKHPEKPKLVQKRMPRQLRNFQVPTEISFQYNEANKQHVMSLTTLDQPGLLARISQVFLNESIEVHAARITTLGERAEDMFYLSDKGDAQLSNERLAKLERSLQAVLQTNDETLATTQQTT